MDADTEKTAKPRRRWLQFSLRTLLIVVTVWSVPLGWVGWRLGEVRRERATITWVEKMGGGVYYQSNYKPDDRSWWEESTDKWFGERVRLVGFHYRLMDFRYRQVSDLSPLAELKNLEVLLLHNTQVSDLSPLVELKSLKGLHLQNTQVSDLSLLAELKNLEMLTLRHKQVSDLSPLAELKNLKWLDLRNTPVSDLSLLAGLKNLESLYLQNTGVSDEQVQELRQALPKCDIGHASRVEK